MAHLLKCTYEKTKENYEYLRLKIDYAAPTGKFYYFLSVLLSVE